ncbi:MAG: response regulator transcription factor [Candidatus Obscuribacterales bacterium]|nr:response regulator transcription factor [Candidatus Obscuribacterales bacterium]
MSKILIIDDDESLTANVKKWLEHDHYIVETASTGPDGLHLMSVYQYDVVVLDVNLPKMNGFDVCQKYRQGGGQAPVIMLTGRSELADKETGFGAGIDDYLSKPFHIRELSMRVKALLNRSRTIKKQDILEAGTLVLDRQALSVKRAGQEIKLQRMEFMLLEFFMLNQGHCFSPDALLSRVWSANSEATPESLRTTIRKLRSKIDTEDGPSLIVNVHGIGYKFEP